MNRTVWVGYDPREVSAFAVARASIMRRNGFMPVQGLVLEDLRARRLYTRPTAWDFSSIDHPIMIDVLSKRPDYDGRVSTEFAISRFLTPLLAKSGMAMFMDCDVLVLADVARAFEIAEANKDKALFCVHHNHEPAETVKMDGQVQLKYDRKNWSSVMIFNCDHPSNKKLTLEAVNALPGRDLHRFCWLEDDEIGELETAWNVLVGYTVCPNPKIIHFTSGGPWMRGYEDVQYAHLWREELLHWVKHGIG